MLASNSARRPRSGFGNGIEFMAFLLTTLDASSSGQGEVDNLGGLAGVWRECFGGTDLRSAFGAGLLHLLRAFLIGLKRARLLGGKSIELGKARRAARLTRWRLGWRRERWRLGLRRGFRSGGLRGGGKFIRRGSWGIVYQRLIPPGLGGRRGGTAGGVDHDDIRRRLADQLGGAVLADDRIPTPHIRLHTSRPGCRGGPAPA